MIPNPLGPGVPADLDFFTHGLAGLAVSGALVLTRVGSAMVFAPVFSSVAVPPRVKAGFTVAITALLTPVLAHGAGTAAEITVSGIMGELGVGLLFGLSLGFYTELLNFAAALLSMEFSFSLVNLMDPNTQVETPVLGQLLGWVGVLVLLGAGLHRTLLQALIETFRVVPPGHAALAAHSAAAVAHMAAGIFVAGLQLASPVVAAALAVEAGLAFLARIAPGLPSGVMGVPFKTLVSYVVLIGSLAVWPWFLERRFALLLNCAVRLVQPNGTGTP